MLKTFGIRFALGLINSLTNGELDKDDVVDKVKDVITSQGDSEVDPETLLKLKRIRRQNLDK